MRPLCKMKLYEQLTQLAWCQQKCSSCFPGIKSRIPGYDSLLFSLSPGGCQAEVGGSRQPGFQRVGLPLCFWLVYPTGSGFLVVSEVVRTQKVILWDPHHWVAPNWYICQWPWVGWGQATQTGLCVCVCHKGDNHSHFKHYIQTPLYPAKNHREHFLSWSSFYEGKTLVRYPYTSQDWSVPLLAVKGTGKVNIQHFSSSAGEGRLCFQERRSRWVWGGRVGPWKINCRSLVQKKRMALVERS